MDRLEGLVTEIEGDGGRALAIETDVTDRAQATGAWRPMTLPTRSPTSSPRPRHVAVNELLIRPTEQTG
jgi:hypothetical protein